MAIANEMLDTLLGMDTERRKEILALMAGSDASKLEALEKDVESQREKREKAIQRKAEEAEKQARKDAIEALTVRVETLDMSDEDFADDLEALFEDAVELKGHIVVDGVHEGVVSFTVLGLEKPKSGNKKGRPKKDTPTNYTDADGNRVLGAITDWARENVPAETLESDYLKDVPEDFDTKKKVPFKLAGENLAAKLVKDGFLVESEYTPEDENEEDATATE